MKARISVAIILAASVVAAIFAILHPPGQKVISESEQTDSTLASALPEPVQPPEVPDRIAATRRPASRETETTVLRAPAEAPAATTNKLERLAQTRESFRALAAAGDPGLALRAAKLIKDETERETALLTLVTEWTHGELRSPRERARAIAAYGLEAGLGMELVKNPELASLWANALTESQGRTALLGTTAVAMVGSNPAAAFALGDQLAQSDRRRFLDTVFGGWANKDTEAALRWVDQIPDPAERDTALTAIRNVAPVGIGAALTLNEDGYAVINQILPGAPAELSGQLHAGDRIMALAQGDNTFVDAHSLSLKDIVDMVRGARGSVLQLQVLSADAPPNSPPRTVPIIRDQIKYKR